MSLLALLRNLKEMEERISISDPIEVEKPLVFLTVPGRNQPLSRQEAVFEHFPEVSGDEDRIGTLREDLIVINVRFSSYDANFDRATEIAVAYFDAFHDAIDQERYASRRLNGAFDHLTIRTEQGAPFQSFEGRPGWELQLEFRVFKEVD